MSNDESLSDGKIDYQQNEIELKAQHNAEMVEFTTFETDD